MELLTEGNAAKLYCLNWIEAHAREREALTILDLGCGQARNFVRLLVRYPQVRYVGIEPSPGDCAAARRNLEGLNATVINGYAYAVYGTLVQEQFDLVVSFSVLEHVYQRAAYLRAAAQCLKADGHFLINYDAGHFVDPVNLRERLKNLAGPLLARLGQERYFQAFVREADFLAMVSAAGLRVQEARSFNTMLKGVYKHVPQAGQAEFMQRWLELEQWLNEQDIRYDDSKARTWFTRNFILRRA